MKTIYIEHEELPKGIQVIISQSSKETKPKIFECENEYVMIAFECEEKNNSVHNKTDDDTIQEIYAMLNDNQPIKLIADKLGLSTKTIYNYKKQKQD